MTGAPVRYVACHPGALVHQDHKKLGRVPDGGGWRVLGRDKAPHHGHSNAGYEHLEVFVDDASRYAVVVPVADERAESAAWAVELAVTRFAEAGIRIERILTDNGASYRSHTYRDTLVDLDIRHKRTRPFRPQTNGKAERFIRTLHRGRPHTALRGLVPRAAVNNVPKQHTRNGPRTRDIGGSARTVEMGDAIVAAISAT